MRLKGTNEYEKYPSELRISSASIKTITICCVQRLPEGFISAVMWLFLAFSVFCTIFTKKNKECEKFHNIGHDLFQTLIHQG